MKCSHSKFKIIIFTLLILLLFFISLFGLAKEVVAGVICDWCDPPGWYCMGHPFYCECWQSSGCSSDCGGDYGWRACVNGAYCGGCTSSCPCGGGCFVEGTSVASEQLSDQAIEKLKPGDVVSSFNPETGEVSESQVSEVHKIEREGYYELETESGKKVKVTGEHPFLAIKAKNFQLIDKLKNFLSHTLTFRLIISLRTKLGEVW